ncbi:MAG: response regulator [Moraxellaceae bacterium]|nr:response regulator [Moraxellaceae bacterium]
MSAWVIAVLVLLYVGLIFAVASWGERPGNDRLIRRHGGVVLSLALAVYCTSWTYYGAVGSAVRHGWDYLPIYLGPILVFVFAQPFLRKLAFVARKENVTSIAHFISARYGKRRNIARLAALTCLVVVVPYIALQLKAVSDSYQVLVGAGGAPGWWPDSALLSAVAMTVFAILFGTRKLQLTEQRRGLLLAIAFESAVKLFALLLLAGVAMVFLLDREHSVLALFAQNAHAQRSLAGPGGLVEFITKTGLAMAAIFLLPRQFHIAFIENDAAANLRQARVGFTLYLLLVSLVVIPVAVTGMQLFPGQFAAADSFVLRIPAESGWPVLSVLVFLGGFSAATSMIIVSTLALSTMLSNEVVMPRLLAVRSEADYSGLILRVRRSMIVLVMALAYFYYRGFARNYELAETGLLAFSLVIQLAPAVIGGLYWRRGNAWGVYAGLGVGLVLWLLTLILPQLAGLGLLQASRLEWLATLPGFGPGRLSGGVLLSLGANTLVYVLVSRQSRVGLADRLQAAAFVNPGLPVDREHLPRPARITQADLQALIERFTGRPRAVECLAEYAVAHFVTLDPAAPCDAALLAYAERELAGVIGASSAAAVINAILERRQMGVEDVVTLFDDTSQAIRFSRTILHSTLEHLSQGVSVVDKDLNLVAWNRAYLELFGYPEGMIRVGKPVAEIVRFNAGRGLCGPGSVEEHVGKRILHMRNGTGHVFQRIMPDGRVVEMRGNPIPGGGFVTSFTDISEYVKSVNALAVARDSLEARVQERTQTISEMNAELRGEIERRRETEQQLLQAKAEAEAANASKTRFLALASHDILQPLNAARLFTAALATSPSEERRGAILGQLDKSLAASEELISSLLEIAKLEDGRMRPDLQPVCLRELLAQLADEYELIASQKGLQLWVRIPEYTVLTDATYLRRILQNLLSNAVKYTPAGKILLSGQAEGDRLTLEVRDTGPGIAAQDLPHIFEDFYRVEATASGQQGLGLGLGVVSRMARLLGHELSVQSAPGQGSVFSLTLPLVADRAPHATVAEVAGGAEHLQPGLDVICVDDDRSNLAALQVLLEQWQINCTGSFHTREAVLAHAATMPAPDVLIIDYQLGRGLTGLELFARLREYWPAVDGILVSAAPEPDLAARTRQQGMLFLAKPIKPAALRASLNHLRSQRRIVDVD